MTKVTKTTCHSHPTLLACILCVMKTFPCHCGNRLYFENSQCLTCNSALGYLPHKQCLSALRPTGEGLWRALADGKLYQRCGNYHAYRICNWLLPAKDSHAFCVSCRLNQVIPNLEKPENLTLWQRIETAKRRLLYTLHTLRLPLVNREQDPWHGLAFEFLEGGSDALEFSNRFDANQDVMTGHSAGIITINVAETKDAAREEMREKMNEGYRTLLGHFRHEIGHYYWDRLIAGSARLESFRALFGDERADYDQALRHYYQVGPSPQWVNAHISAYASAHPWEDWAETWAHYLHMVDTLETAHDFGSTVNGQHRESIETFQSLVTEWRQLTQALNALNRSMGLNDAYPFNLTDAACEKLRFVHDLINAG